MPKKSKLQQRRDAEAIRQQEDDVARSPTDESPPSASENISARLSSNYELDPCGDLTLVLSGRRLSSGEVGPNVQCTNGITSITFNTLIDVSQINNLICWMNQQRP